MKRLTVILLFGAVALLAWPVEATVEAEAELKCADPPCSTPLLAGQTIDVGTVDVFYENGTLRVVFNIEENNGWFLTETHLFVGTNEPTKSAPGRFPYKHEDLDYVATDSYEFSFPIPPTECLYFAAHAVVETVVGYEFVPEDFQFDLPDQVTMKVTQPADRASYFTTQVLEGPLAGFYDGWCIDIGHTISLGPTYTANVYSSYEQLPDEINIDKPEFLPQVNYIINHFHEGEPSSSGTPFTACDIQRAIWTLIDDSMTGCGTYEQTRVNEIVAAAWANGYDFEPECGGIVAVILVPVDTAQVTIGQVTLIEEPNSEFCTPVYESETAWGDGERFGKGWATYFSCFCP